MDGKMKMPQSDHLQSGYKYNFTNKKSAESYQHLAVFPSDLEITHELAVAESQARKIALFAGIDPSIINKTQPAQPSPVAPNDDEDANEGNGGVSISNSANYNVAYSCVPGETPLSDIMHEAANTIGEKQQINTALEDIDIDEELHQVSGQARMAISNLLNPVTPKSPGLSVSFLAERSEDKFPIVVPTSDGSEYNLNVNLMIELRKKHDTENRNRHSGNEIKKKHNFLLTNQSNSNRALRPSDCSKLVALVLKNNTSQHSSIARMHRWNIHVQFNLSEVRNTLTHVDVNAQLLVQGGQISETNELKDGKFAVIVKDKKMYIASLPNSHRFLQHLPLFSDLCAPRSSPPSPLISGQRGHKYYGS
ncbi:hypothetical protein PCANC_11432 [Puccinia coronata f. sp. avenae]|uniref:Uncharacterized protein n=1 Tax=Puccinia coronata f. sp. avenae TaxID=200324 RepID=A0A2N5VMJ8_9BASI|nr:hypothetical protein PCANC_11432 [Puccinia coronata f. sp. avenae]